MAATKPLITEAIALTEKKMDMTLEDIIKMSKNTTTKDKKPRVPNKSQKFVNNIAQDKSSKVRRFMDSRSSFRQGVLAQRRSNFQRNQFPHATEVARKAAVAPLRNGVFNRNRVANWNKPRVGAPAVQRNAVNGGFAVKQQQQQQQQVQGQQQVNGGVMMKKPQTLDSLFANMKEQRLRGLTHQNNGFRRNNLQQRPQQWGRGRFGRPN